MKWAGGPTSSSQMLVLQGQQAPEDHVTLVSVHTALDSILMCCLYCPGDPKPCLLPTG